jgi:hypothetical protein
MCTVLAVLAAAAPATAASPTAVTCAGLQSAVNTAAAGDVLQLPAGTCSANITVTNTAAFTLEGAGGGGTTTLQPTNTAIPIIAGASSTFTLTDLTFTGELSASAVKLTGAGEAATISGDTFSNDTTSGSGGAVLVQPGATMTTTHPTVISGDTFTHDSAVGGGAIDLLNFGAPLTVSHDTFTADSSSADGGGALFFSLNPTTSTAAQITDNEFGGQTGEGNTTEGQGGAIWAQLSPTVQMTLSGNTFEGNAIAGTQTATDGTQRWGGAVFLLLTPETAGFTVDQSHNNFLGNAITETAAPSATSVPTGGGAEFIVGGTVDSLDDVFNGNRIAVNNGAPPEGAAVGALASNSAISPTEPGVFTGTNDLFSGNSVVAGGWGGAIYVGGVPLYCNTPTCLPSTATLNDSTVVGNSVGSGGSSEGGAIWGSAGDHLTLRNSIVYGNTPAPELWGFGSGSPVIAYSDACGEPGGVPVPKASGNICANPALTAAGLETDTSPTLDAGSNALVPSGVITDLAGNPRIQANRTSCGTPVPAIVDMGAYEFTGHQPPPPCPVQIPLRIDGTTLHDRSGAASVKLTCGHVVALCDGKLTLTSRGKHPVALGSAKFTLSRGKSKSIKVRLSKKGLRKLDRRGKRETLRILIVAQLRHSVALTAMGTLRVPRR